MRYASTFLSHSSADKALVNLVAKELCRLGVLSWLDFKELRVGQTLDQCLQEAINQQMTFTVFLSEKSVQSSWVQDELTAAFNKLNDDLLMPVYLGDSLQLLKSHDQLRRWLHPEGDRVSKLGIVPRGRSKAARAKDIAQQLARNIFFNNQFKQSRELAIVLDQRGNGARTGEPEFLPENIKRQDIPVLVFRPDDDVRSQADTLHGEDWAAVRDSMLAGLADALGTPQWSETKKIHVLGAAQLGLGYLVGHHFNRNTSADLYCYGRHGLVFTNKGQQRYTSIGNSAGANAYCETSHPLIQPLADNERYESMALFLGVESFVAPVHRYLQTRQNPPPLCWVQSGEFADSEQVMEYIQNVVALLQRLSRDHQVKTLYLFCGLPLIMMPLLAANLLHVIDNVVFMENRRDLKNANVSDDATYVELKMSG